MSAEVEAWRLDAACIDHPEVDFFPNRGAPLGPAKAICATCTVADQCLDYALTNGIKHGIWGGQSERARRGMRATRPRAVAPARPIEHGTNGGYQAHLRRNERPCDACRAAKATYHAEYRAKRAGTSA